MHLKPGAHPAQVRATQAAPEKAHFLNTFVQNVVAAGMVVVALGSRFASSTTVVVKPSSVRGTASVTHPGLESADMHVKKGTPA